jgi:tRNA/rRNA methyltransferase
MPSLASVRIVLVEPAGPLNVGAIARVMKNMGLAHLVLVKPQCDPLGQEARQMAVHAGDVLEAAQVVGSLPAGLQGCRRAIATTGRPRTPAIHLEHPRNALPWLLESVEPSSAALIFGPEDRGLNNTELNQAQRFIYIPTNPVYPSLNLAQAVGICCYELFQLAESARVEGRWDGGTAGQHLTPHSPTPPLPHSPTPPAPLEELEAFYRHLETVLLQIGYLYPHTADSRMKKFRRLFSRGLPSSVEVAMLQGVLSQVEWALRNPNRNEDL